MASTSSVRANFSNSNTRPSSAVWRYFEKSENESKCMLFGKIVKHLSNTSNLLKVNSTPAYCAYCPASIVMTHVWSCRNVLNIHDFKPGLCAHLLELSICCCVHCLFKKRHFIGLALVLKYRYRKSIGTDGINQKVIGIVSKFK